MPDGIVRAVIETNHIAADQMAHRVAPMMVEPGWGRIVNVTTKLDTIVLHWHRTNMTAPRRLVAKARDVFRAAGYPFVLTHAFDRRTPSHQCGTARMGTDPATSVLDVFCRTHDHANLFVVDAAFLPTSAAVNPSLTIAAQALRVADHIVQEGFRA